MAKGSAEMKTDTSPSSSSLVQVLRSPHLPQILLLLFSLSCCGSLVGLSRLLPRLASQTFHTTSQTLILYVHLTPHTAQRIVVSPSSLLSSPARPS